MSEDRIRTLILVPLLAVACLAQNRFTDSGKTFSQDGTLLLSFCTASPSGNQTGFYQETMLCGGYVEGVADTLSDRSICIPSSVEGKELVATFAKYATKHQDKLHGPASRVVANALEESYPCVHSK